MAKTYLAVVEEVILRAYSVVQQLPYNLYNKPSLQNHTCFRFYVLVQNCIVKIAQSYVFTVIRSCFSFTFYVIHAVCYYK